MEWADWKDSSLDFITFLEMIVIHRMTAGPDSRKPDCFPVFCGQEEKGDDEIRRIGNLVDAWLMQQYQSEPNTEAASRFERKLHTAIKTSSLHGKVLSFAGLNIWVDDRTPDGVVQSQEAINL
jgi:hypothetical protein